MATHVSAPRHRSERGARATHTVTSGPRTERLLVQVLLRSLQDALRAHAGEADGEKRHALALSELTLSFASLWSRLPHLALDLTPSGIRWDGHDVLPADEDTVGLGAMLRQSGIQRIELRPGVEAEEMARLVQVLDRKRRLDVAGDLDLVTMLFREDFQHVTAVHILDRAFGFQDRDRAIQSFCIKRLCNGFH